MADIIEELVISYYVCCVIPLILFTIWLSIIMFIVRKRDYSKHSKFMIVIGISLLFIGTPFAIIDLFGLINEEEEKQFELLAGDKKEFNGDYNKGTEIWIRYNSDNPVENVGIYEVIQVRNMSSPYGGTYPERYNYDYIFELRKLVAVNSTSGSVKYTISHDGNYSVIFNNSMSFGIKNGVSNVNAYLTKYHDGRERTIKVGDIAFIVGLIVFIIGIFNSEKHKEKKERDRFFVEEKGQDHKM